MDKNTTNKQNSSDENIQIFCFTSCDESWKSYLDKGIIINFSTFGMILISLFCLLNPGFYFSKMLHLIIFKLIGIGIFILAIWIHLNIISEARIDNEFLYIRKFKYLKKIPLQYIQKVKVIRMLTNGVTYVWLRKKKVSTKLLISFFIIWTIPSEKEKTELFEKLLSEINKRIN